MKKKVIYLVTAIALTLATVKTGYAYYGKSLGSFGTEQMNGTKLSYNSTPIIQTTTKLESVEADDKDYATDNSKQCCGIGLGSMIDENGDFKNREIFEQELNESVQSGKMSEEDKEYYLFMYDKCVSTVNSNDSNQDEDNSVEGSNSNNGSFNPPSCH